VATGDKFALIYATDVVMQLMFGSGIKVADNGWCYTKEAIITTKVDAEYKCLFNHKCFCGVPNRLFCIARVMCSCGCLPKKLN
jgi:hypothetical protein